MTPKDFDKCVAEGGRVRTMTLKNNKYMRVCWDKNGKSHAGEVKTKKTRWDERKKYLKGGK